MAFFVDKGYRNKRLFNTIFREIDDQVSLAFLTKSTIVASLMVYEQTKRKIKDKNVLEETKSKQAAHELKWFWTCL